MIRHRFWTPSAIATVTALAILVASPGASADCTGALETKVVPLPVWATTPNEGNTWGVMPVFVRVCPDSKVTQWILAPGVTWNDIIHFTGTVRFFDYPDPDTTFTIIASASTRINYGVTLIWQRQPTAEGAFTDEVTARALRSAFARFFGLGPDTPASAEASYTGSRAFVTARRGLNLAHHLNVGLTLGLEHDGVDDQGVPDLPLAPDLFPDTPGMDGASLAWQGLDLRYDDRPGRDFADGGVALEVSGAVVEGLSDSPTFFRFGAQARAIVPELGWLSGAARLSYSGVTADGVPFYQQSQLGGAFLLRGFTEGRFTDRQAWTVELEQRIRVFQTHLFGVVADWRVDPFVTAGQVFGDWGGALSNPQVAAGAGLRAFVHPNVVGRIDLASGGEGLKVYVEIGYPY